MRWEISGNQAPQRRKPHRPISQGQYHQRVPLATDIIDDVAHRAILPGEHHAREDGHLLALCLACRCIHRLVPFT
jgi:hypothetical protein